MVMRMKNREIAGYLRDLAFVLARRITKSLHPKCVERKRVGFGVLVASLGLSLCVVCGARLAVRSWNRLIADF
jgi:hypothetical protein